MTFVEKSEMWVAITMSYDVNDCSSGLLYYSNCAFCSSDDPHLLELKRLWGMHLFTFVTIVVFVCICVCISCYGC